MDVVNSFGGFELIATYAPSAVATLDITAGFSSDYDVHLITYDRVTPATDAVTLSIRFSQNAGSTFLAGATDYTFAGLAEFSEATNAANNSTGTTAITICTAVGNVALEAISGWTMLVGMRSSAGPKRAISYTSYATAAGLHAILYTAGALILNETAVNGIRFLHSSGNIASGNVSVYGLRKL